MKFRLSGLFGLFAFLAACATTPRAADSVDSIAEAYVRLSLEAGKREDGYVDAYYGPAEWKQQAEAAPRSVADLQQAATNLQTRLRALLSPADPLARRRIAFLDGQLEAARTRLRMIAGERLSFADEARGLFGIVPDIQPLSHYDALLAQMQPLLPGSGTLAERADALQNRFIIPPARLDAVMRAAVAECRRRTLQHIPMPEGEAFTLEFVTGKSWSAYNWYQGNFRSLIQVNTDLPVRLSRVVDLACHEGYPGHHVYNALLERELVRTRGWVEYSVYPLYSPQSFIAEGSATYGMDLAFPPAELEQYQRNVLAPLAGLDAREVGRYARLQRALDALQGARITIAREFLEGRMTRAQAIEATQRYLLVDRARAEQLTAFTEQYRTYVMNYGYGEELIRAHLERTPAGSQRWAAMRRLLSEPTVPSELTPSSRSE